MFAVSIGVDEPPGVQNFSGAGRTPPARSNSSRSDAQWRFVLPGPGDVTDSEYSVKPGDSPCPIEVNQSTPLSHDRRHTGDATRR